MQFGRLILVGLASTSFAACEQEPAAVANVERNLMVSGPRGDVERFVRLQEALSPPLKTWPISELSGGRAQATVTIPADYTTDEVAHTAREAIAAGLTWWFRDIRLEETAALRRTTDVFESRTRQQF
jgi:hypothetical protein